MSSNFDEISSDYSDLVEGVVSFSGQEHDFYIRRKATALVDLASRLLGHPETLRVLDVGCGIGLTDAHLVGRFDELHGVDTARAAITRAADRNPTVQYRTYGGERLPYRDREFDLAFTICVMHHVPRAQWPRFVSELGRVVQPQGLVVVLEHNPLNPLTRATVSRCEFDKDADLLRRRKTARLLEASDLEVVEHRYLIFTPIDARLAAWFERRIAWLPLGAQYYVAARRSRP
jgi:ubiquinone/menaquinone biosynthesis C-methylase UbiE